MFRKRPPRRRPFLRRRPFRHLSTPPGAPLGQPLASKLRKILARANRLMAEGQFAEAAAIYERLYEEGQERGFVARAAEVALQASRARFAAGDVDAALQHAKEALRLLIHSGRAGRVPQALSRMTAALRSKGHETQAGELEREARRFLGEIGLSLEEAQQQAPQMPEERGTLPAKCSGCGAPVVPDEVEWHDAQTAECLYCGTVLKST
jgi:tetratricopeptide (TPR) repeat protein